MSNYRTAYRKHQLFIIFCKYTEAVSMLVCTTKETASIS